jgi:hypothetical protein
MRILIALTTLGLLVIGTGGVVAAGGGSSNGQSAAKSEYKPGLGPCKDGGQNPSGTHTGPPGQPDANCETKPGNGKGQGRAASAAAPCRTGSSFAVRSNMGRLRSVKVNGRTFPVVDGRVRIPMPPAFRGAVTIDVVAKSKGGRTMRGTRVFDPCATRRNPTVRVTA